MMAVRVTRLYRQSVLPTLRQKDGLSSSCEDCDHDDGGEAGADGSWFLLRKR